MEYVKEFYEGTIGPFDHLVLAAEQNDINTIRNYINKGGDPNKHSLLLHATGNGRYEIVRLLINAGADVNKRAQWWDTTETDGITTPINLLCNDELRWPQFDDGTMKNGNDDDYIEVLKLLINAGADVNAKDNTGTYFPDGAAGSAPLHKLADGWEDIYNLAVELINAGADVNITDDEGNTPLHIYFNKLFYGRDHLKFGLLCCF